MGGVKDPIYTTSQVSLRSEVLTYMDLKKGMKKMKRMCITWDFGCRSVKGKFQCKS